MFRKLLIGTAIASMMAFGITTGASAQESQDTAGQHMKKAGKATKKAGKATGEAVKETGKATGKVAKKTGQVTEDAAKETATGTKKAAKKVAKKVTPDTTSATCNDGTVQSGKTKTTACANHGGVKG
jgi:hypothetical protein